MNIIIINKTHPSLTQGTFFAEEAQRPMRAN